MLRLNNVKISLYPRWYIFLMLHTLIELSLKLVIPFFAALAIGTIIVGCILYGIVANMVARFFLWIIFGVINAMIRTDLSVDSPLVDTALFVFAVLNTVIALVIIVNLPAYS
jgi:hypothetical protein